MIPTKRLTRLAATSFLLAALIVISLSLAASDARGDTQNPIPLDSPSIHHSAGRNEPPSPNPAHTTLVIHYLGDSPPPALMNDLAALRAAGQISAVDATSEPGRVFVLGEEKALQAVKERFDAPPSEERKAPPPDQAIAPESPTPLSPPEQLEAPDPQAPTTFYLALNPTQPASARQRLVRRLQTIGTVTEQGHSLRLTAPATAAEKLSHLPGVMFVSQAPEPEMAGITANGYITGVVTADDGGAPLVGASACANQSDPYVYECGTVDASGVYSISLPGGTYHVIFYSNDYHISEYYDDVPLDMYDSRTLVAVVDDTVTPNINAGLAPGAQIIGTVTDQASTNPLQSISVGAVDLNYYYQVWGYTNASGVYTTTPGLPAGSYQVEFVDYSGMYALEYYDDVYLPSQATLLEITSTHRTGIDAALAQAAVITGTVTGPAPLENIYVSAYYAAEYQFFDSDYTDVSGTYRLEGMSPIGYKLRFRDNDGQYLEEWHQDKLDWDTADPITLTSGVTTTVDAELAAAGLLSGTITDENSGLPLDGIRTRVYDAATGDYIDGDYTDSSGVYLIGGLAAGNYKLRFTDYDGRYLEEYYDDKPDLDSADPVAVTAGMTSTASAELAPAGLISGTVTAEDSGLPLTNVQISTYDASTGGFITSDYTDDSGRYLVGGLTAGNYKLRFVDYDGGYLEEYYDDKPDLDSADPVAVSSGVTATASAALAPAGLISGVVTAEDSGLPLTNVRTSVYDASTGGFITSDYTDANGAYLIGGLTSGSYKLRFYDGDGQYLTEYYDDKPDLNSADPVAVTAGMTTTHIDAQLTEAGLISGTVTAQDTGLPLTNVRARAYEAATGDFINSDYTDDSGNYLVGGLTSGSYKLLFTDYDGNYLEEYYDDKPDFDSADPVAVTAGMTTTHINAELSPAGLISGVVTAEMGGAPLEGISVYAYEAASGDYADNDYTDATGAYLLGGLASGDYKLRFSDNDDQYLTEYYDDKPDSSSADPVAVTAGMTTTNINAQLAQAGLVSGTVTAEDSGLPLTNVRVRAYDAVTGDQIDSDYTDDSGHYLVGGLASGPHKLRFTDYDGLYLEEYYDDKPDLDSADPITISAGVTTTGIDAQLARAGVVSGTVTAEDSGLPLTNVRVRVYEAGTDDYLDSDYTDGSGVYFIGELATDQYKLRFTDQDGDYLEEYYNNRLNLSSADPVSVTAGTTTTVDAALSRGGRITGRVIDAETGLGLEDVYVDVDRMDASTSSGSAYTDASGYYTTSALYSGVYRVNFNPDPPYYEEDYDNFETGDDFTPVVVTAPLTVTHIDADLTPGYFISGTVTGAGSAPLEDVRVEAYYSADSYNSKSDYTDSQGRYLIGPLDPGPYRVLFHPPDLHASQWYSDSADYVGATVINLSGNQTGIDAELGQGSQITGSVTGAGGEPLPDVWVYVYPAGSEESIASGETDATGHYVTEPGLATGLYQVHFSAPTGYNSEWYDSKAAQADATVISVTAGISQTHIDARLNDYPTGAISGHITAADTGLPLSGWVYAYNPAGSSVRSVYASDGSYVLDSLPPNTYRVRFSSLPSPYIQTYYDTQFDLDDATPITVTAGVTVTGIDQAIPRGGAITGTVSGSGGIAGVYVYARRVVGGSTTRSTYTGPDGGYSFEGMDPGGYSLKFSPPAPFIRQWYTGALLEDDAQTVTVTLGSTTPGINASLATGGVISGTITAADTGEPLFSAYVRVYSTTGSFSSDSVYADMDGHYQTTGLPAGAYQVDFDAGRWDFYRDEWYQDAPTQGESLTVTLPASGTVPNIDATLDKGGSISGWTYDDETGLLLPDVYAAAYQAPSISYVGNDYSNDWGFYQITALESGPYKVKFTESGYVDQWYREALDSDTALTVTVEAPDDTPNVNAYLYQSHPYGIYLPIVMRGQP